ncbi:MAG: hypothetical protein JKY66_08410 [Spongiibacteraceae bacterium]|nr:hypothetical protein [Spongiibacteraceae bacterium]
MTQENVFFSKAEQALSQAFIDKGYIVIDVENQQALQRLQSLVVDSVCEYLGDNKPDDAKAYLDTIHQQVNVSQLNALRLHVIQVLNSNEQSRQHYLSLARAGVEALVGNELAMQRRINLSIQMPDDSSSLLPIHSDVWSGDSPFEVVVWVPLVDCYNTKTMYIVNPTSGEKIKKNFSQFSNSSAEDVYQAVAKDAEFLKVKFGQVLVFSQTLMHGNRINEESGTRWSMNLRVKSLLSPYDDKRLGEFFEPITLRAATRIGMQYRYYDGFNDE